MSTPPSGLEGIGKAKWGDTRWGSGITPPPGPPVITPLEPVNDESDVSPSHPIFIRLTDDSLVNQATLRITVGPTIYVLGGVAQNGATLLVVPNDGNGVDIELILPVPFALGSTQVVVVSVSDHGGEFTELTYHFHVGVGLRMMQVRNPSPNILVAYFNRPLRQDAGLVFTPNWVIAPVSAGAAPLEVFEVIVNSTHTNMATLRYQGGGSLYRITNNQIFDNADAQIDPDFNSAVFEILFGDEPAPTIRLFDTIYGPIGITHQVRLRRTMDDHVIGRSIALGMNEQFRLQSNNLDGSAGRDGRPGKNRI